MWNLQSFLNQSINKLITYAVAVVFLYLYIVTTLQHHKEVSILQTNYDAAMNNHAIEQRLTRQELSKYHSDIDSLRQELKIKAKDVKQVIQIKYNFKDSVRFKDEVRYSYVIDRTTNKVNFIAMKDCYRVYGSVKNDTATISKVELNDKLTTFLYKDYQKKFLFIRWNKFYTAKVYSECMKDTVTVQKNIRIIKNRTDD